MRLHPTLMAGLSALTVLAATGSPLQAQRGPAAANGNSPALTQVARFPAQQITGVAVSKDGRIFVNLPRWTEDVPVSVAEVTSNGELVPYPNTEWNAWRNTKMNSMTPNDHFVCVQSVVFDNNGFLWAVDPASPGNDKVVDGGPKLVKIDTGRNEVVQVIPFDRSVAPPKSYLNDVRFSPDGRTAYLTDSGLGAIIVVDLQSGKARRLLDGDKSTQPEKDVVVKIDGRELRRPDGRGVMFASDGIALSPDGQYLYWQALTGRTLYRMSTVDLNDTHLSPSDLPSRVQIVGTTNVADGLWIDPQGRLYVTAPEENAVKLFSNGETSVLVKDQRLRWPDSFAQGPDGAIYVTASHIQDSPWFRPNRKTTPSAIFKFMPPEGQGTVGAGGQGSGQGGDSGQRGR